MSDASEILFQESEELYEQHSIIIDKGQEALRIDKFLMARIEGATRNKIQQSIERRSRKWNLPNNFAKFELPPDIFRRSSKDLLESLIKAIGDDKKKSNQDLLPRSDSVFLASRL